MKNKDRAKIIENNVGHSSTTPIKQDHFRNILRTHMNIGVALAKKHYWCGNTYWYFDLNAGPGYDLQMNPGSPVIFLEEAINRSNGQFKGVFIEEHQDIYTELFMVEKTFALPENVKMYLHNDDHDHAMKEYFKIKIKRSLPGLVYADGNGIPNFDLLAKISRQSLFKMMDILINCPAAAIKRSRNCGKTKECRTLQEMLSAIKKKHWIIREPYNKFQWTMLIGSNWNQFPSFKKQGFYPIDSLEGKEIFEKLNYTKPELQLIKGADNGK